MVGDQVFSPDMDDLQASISGSCHVMLDTVTNIDGFGRGNLELF
jgi:hypothetical protein